MTTWGWQVQPSSRELDCVVSTCLGCSASLRHSLPFPIVQPFPPPSQGHLPLTLRFSFAPATLCLQPLHLLSLAVSHSERAQSARGIASRSLCARVVSWGSRFILLSPLNTLRENAAKPTAAFAKDEASLNWRRKQPALLKGNWNLKYVMNK